MARLKELMHEARKLGFQHGSNAADWYFDRCENLQREDYLKVLNGIRDGDPEILDTFNSSPLSGEMADDMTPKLLWDEVGANDAQREVAGDEICDQYVRAYESAYESNVVEQCKMQLKRNIAFYVEVELIEQDEHKLLSAIEDLLAQANTSLIESNISEEGEVIDVNA